MLVGCSADSAMQIYVADAAKEAGVLGIVYTARRARRSAATQYALDMGAEVNEIGPGGYLSVLRARAKARAAELGQVVQWSSALAVRDTMVQCANLPCHVIKRVVVPTGSGLTATGVLAGMAATRTGVCSVSVLAVAVSPMADAKTIKEKATAIIGIKEAKLPRFELVRAPLKYGEPLAAVLPDGTPLDPYYAAKALAYLRPGDCLWVPGLRPLAAMPAATVTEIKRLQGELK